MEIACARTRACIRIISQAVVLGLWLLGAAPANAEPSADCRALAVQFGNAADALDLGALAGLVTCVSAEMQKRTVGAAPVSPPSQPAAAPASSSSSAFRQTWPPSAPWGGEWPGVGPDVR
jgi:hypothetical protein